MNDELIYWQSLSRVVITSTDKNSDAITIKVRVTREIKITVVAAVAAED